MNSDIQAVLDGERDWAIAEGDCLEIMREMPDGCVQAVVTSPPYWGLRDYGVDGQLGLEKTPEEYIEKMVTVFREVKRVLRDDGTAWVNMGDSYVSKPSGSFGSGTRPGNGGDYRENKPVVNYGFLKPKDLCGIPWRLAFALRADGWWLRSDIIWAKPNPMPESVTDRPTKSHEYVFLLAKAARYFYDADAVREPIKPTTTGKCSVRPSGDSKTRDKNHWGIPHETKRVERVYDEIRGANLRDVWTGNEQNFEPILSHKDVWKIATAPFPEAHFATFPPKLVEPCVLAGSRERDIVFDPFGGAGTVNMVALRLNRRCISIELNPEYVEIARRRIMSETANLPM